MNPSLEKIAERFGCTIEQVRAQFQKNAKGLRSMAERAERAGRSVNGYSAKQLRAHQVRFESK